MSMNTSAQGRPSLHQCITFQSLLFLKNFLGMRGKYFFWYFHYLKKLYVSPTAKQKQKGKTNLLSEESKQAHTRISTPRYCSPATALEKSLIISKCRESSQEFPMVEVISMECRTHKELKVRSIFSQVLSATDTTLRAPNVCFQLETRNKTTLWV